MALSRRRYKHSEMVRQSELEQIRKNTKIMNPPIYKSTCLNSVHRAAVWVYAKMHDVFVPSTNGRYGNLIGNYVHRYTFSFHSDVIHEFRFSF